ncbi:uncharacterized protein LOC129920571 [Episyrphus balteatus]|uniref:uncharacterized protein LOC129920571 n=1 Tax=Episyrphus balteatus TaxID=286459 RepID=UPI00248588CD|nr:uncharacterized protein LOC129920571 [Episyrphus balteatus]
MGNSGSVNHMQSAGLKELHNYYQAQSNDDDGGGAGINDFTFTRGEQKYPAGGGRPMSIHQSQISRIPSSNRLTSSPSGVNNNINNNQIKVLPKLNENLRLRSTTNGAILHSGGTISGRRESLLPLPLTQPLERSRTFISGISEDDEESRNKNPPAHMMMMMMQRRSQTQLDIDVRKRNPISRSTMLDENVLPKRFSSNLDLRSSATANMETYSNETYQKLSKAKIRTKKRKAPQIPPTEKVPIVEQNFDLDRRQRLFKTKTETNAINNRQQQPINKQSERERERRRCQEPSSPVMMRSKLHPGFRREKSFDAKLLSSEMTRQTEANSQREFNPLVIDAATKRKSLQITKRTLATSTSHSQHPIAVNEIEKSDFKMELEAATKFRFSSMTTVARATTTTEPSARQTRVLNEDKPKPLLPSREIQSKIPQLKKTFYFGMENSKRKSLPATRMTNTTTTTDSSQKIAKPSSSLSSPSQSPLDTNFTPKDNDENENETYSLKHKCGDSKIRNDNGIQLNVRPTLPRRQLEIPRFSPVAAWRTLSASDEQQQHLKEQNAATSFNSPSPSVNTAIAIEATNNTFLIEDRIHRTYRDPCPFYPDNKSGDSGISGDDGYIVEKPIQPRNLQNCCNQSDNFDSKYPTPVMDEMVAPPMKVVGPFLTAWTPKQDLDEDDTSSDGDGNGNEMTINMPDIYDSPTSPHVFSLSLPRENQHSAVYGEKNTPPDFRSLQKLKRTTSGDLNDINCGCTNSSDSQHNLLLHASSGGGGGKGAGDVSLNNFRSDNWVLSKTTRMTTASTYLNNDPNSANHPMDCSSKVIDGGNNYFDLSVSVQPMSLGSLATGKHVMYLPNRTTGESEFKRQSIAPVAIRPPPGDNLMSSKYDKSFEDSLCNSNIPMRNKRFSFQSSVRQVERRRLAEKLSKEADQKEALRKSELEAMRRVEEEFQKKRAYEKASIRQQLRLYSMDDDNFISLPNLNDYRAEPDGAVSSASESPPAPIFHQTPTTIRIGRNFEYPNRGSDLEIVSSNS